MADPIAARLDPLKTTKLSPTVTKCHANPHKGREPMAAQTNQIPVFVGTYTRREPAIANMGKGIQRFMYEPATGELTFVETITGIVNPSFLAIAPNRRFLYSVSESSEMVDGRHTGGITAYAIDPDSFSLHYLNDQPTSGTSPCHLTVDATGRFVMATNYGSASVCVFPILEDGKLGQSTDFIVHQGSSINPQRQQEPHPHSINLDASNRFAFVPDLGTDKVMIYILNTETGKLTPNPEQPWARTKSGAGPRHLAFHPNGEALYVVNELDSTVTGFHFDAARAPCAKSPRFPHCPLNSTARALVPTSISTPMGNFSTPQIAATIPSRFLPLTPTPVN